MPNWTCYFASTIKYYTLVLSQGTQLTVLTALLTNPVLWGQHSSMIVRSIDQCRCQICVKYFGPSRRDQNIYRRKNIFDNRTLGQPPTTTNNHQQPPTTTTPRHRFARGLPGHAFVCDFLDRTTGCWDVRIHVQYVDSYQNILYTDLHEVGGCTKIWSLLKGPKNTQKLEDHVLRFGPSRRDQIESTAKVRPSVDSTHRIVIDG